MCARIKRGLRPPPFPVLVSQMTEGLEAHMQNENFAPAAGHSANCRCKTNVSYAQRGTCPAVNGCVLAAGVSATSTHTQVHKPTRSQRHTDRHAGGETLKQNMITIKTLHTWRIYIIHFVVGFSCHISCHFSCTHFLRCSFCCKPHSFADMHLHVSIHESRANSDGHKFY